MECTSEFVFEKSSHFSLSAYGELYLVPGARYGENNLQINVADADTVVTSTATVRIFYLDDDALDNVASLRLSGQCSQLM